MKYETVERRRKFNCKKEEKLKGSVERVKYGSYENSYSTSLISFSSSHTLFADSDNKEPTIKQGITLQSHTVVSNYNEYILRPRIITTETTSSFKARTTMVLIDSIHDIDI